MSYASLPSRITQLIVLGGVTLGQRNVANSRATKPTSLLLRVWAGLPMGAVRKHSEPQLVCRTWGIENLRA